MRRRAQTSEKDKNTEKLRFSRSDDQWEKGDGDFYQEHNLCTGKHQDRYWVNPRGFDKSDERATKTRISLKFECVLQK
ncbi:hypothetical protein OUZ56_005360 [Daphnia magna]|uniref:Uncharacterized protein n=1 Tax=Daphnia magna TaxID=35525 RepID=A0ABQ9YTB7_9CRUS|nr:hypothetical protein OUZ56_005360 [Daphnia magna]